jgi:uncharacterized cupin superfamily protein
MLTRNAVLLYVLMSTAFVAAADDAPKTIVKFGGADLGSLMQSSAAVKKTTEIRSTTAVPMFKSSDAKFSSGLFSSTAGHVEFESYAGDEFCYFVSGEATITSADGSVLKLKAGDAITIPKGWKGRWDTSGYTKYFVSYRSTN